MNNPLDALISHGFTKHTKLKDSPLDEGRVKPRFEHTTAVCAYIRETKNRDVYEEITIYDMSCRSASYTSECVAVNLVANGVTISCNFVDSDATNIDKLIKFVDCALRFCCDNV